LVCGILGFLYVQHGSPKGWFAGVDVSSLVSGSSQVDNAATSNSS
jgi:hypothetical protein